MCQTLEIYGVWSSENDELSQQDYKTGQFHTTQQTETFNA